MTLRAPFPWFGGKSRVADVVWQRFGDVANYVEPFAGSLAVLMSRPQPFAGVETVNDKDGFVANFWRAVAADPDAVMRWADWPVNENDLHARHSWLIARRGTLDAALNGDPHYYDAKIAGWWVWGICLWIGSGWCSGSGPWQVNADGQLVHVGDAGMGIHRKRVHVGDAGMGIHRKLVHVGDAGMGIHRKRGDDEPETPIGAWFTALQDRLRRVRVCSGDWSRVMGPAVTVRHGLTGVFLDPPYADTADRTDALYATDSLSVAHDVREWAIANGDDPRLRIALCGYDGEHAMPEHWASVAWKSKGGYGSQGNGRGRENAARERIWFSPHCLSARAQRLWDCEATA